MGAKHSQFSQARPPVNVLTYVDSADKFLSKILRQKKSALREAYDWLSEFCHPNYLSNTGAFDLDKENGRFMMRHGGNLTARDLSMFGYLDLSALIFIQFFDEFGLALEKATLD